MTLPVPWYRRLDRLAATEASGHVGLLLNFIIADMSDGPKRQRLFNTELMQIPEISLAGVFRH